MKALDSAVCLMDDFLDFASDIDQEESFKPPFTSNGLCPAPLPEFAEEELEWLSNKDAFPAVETFVGILPKQGSPVSVLTVKGGSLMTDYCRNLQIPVKARSNHRRRRRSDLQWWPSNEKARKTAAIGRKCQHCGAEKTPQWRAGPLGPKTLCNACGVRYKSGRLVEEYRPASSPSFRREMHSNSHRKVLEMRKRKEVMGFVGVKATEEG